MNVLDEWIKVAAAELGLTADDVPRGPVLDLARDVAHNVVRPGAPVSAYLMGLAVGRGADPADAAARLSELALKWTAGGTQNAATNGSSSKEAEPDRSSTDNAEQYRPQAGEAATDRPGKEETGG